jgi:hypothetical protein
LNSNSKRKPQRSWPKRRKRKRRRIKRRLRKIRTLIKTKIRRNKSS